MTLLCLGILIGLVLRKVLWFVRVLFWHAEDRISINDERRQMMISAEHQQ